MTPSTPQGDAIMAFTVLSTMTWAEFFKDTSLIASTVIYVTGAILGLHAVYKLWKNGHSK